MRFSGIYVLYVKFDSKKTHFSCFGYWRPGVRISTLRPKKKREPLWFSFAFCRCGWWELHSCEARRSIAARGGVCNNYTYCTNCNYLLLAWQDTDHVSMRILHAEVSSLLVNRKCKYLRIANTSTLRPKSAFCTRKTAYFAGFRLFFSLFYYNREKSFFIPYSNVKKSAGYWRPIPVVCAMRF